MGVEQGNVAEPSGVCARPPRSACALGSVQAERYGHKVVSPRPPSMLVELSDTTERVCVSVRLVRATATVHYMSYSNF